MFEYKFLDEQLRSKKNLYIELSKDCVFNYILDGIEEEKLLSDNTFLVNNVFWEYITEEYSDIIDLFFNGRSDLTDLISDLDCILSVELRLGGFKLNQQISVYSPCGTVDWIVEYLLSTGGYNNVKSFRTNNKKDKFKFYWIEVT